MFRRHAIGFRSLLMLVDGWVIVLDLHGLSRPRARWTIRSEALAVARSAVVMALVTLSVLFVFRLPDVSRSLLVAVFPAQWALPTVTRIALRAAFERMGAPG